MSTPNTPITLAFAGHGDVDLDNVKALLNDFVGLGEEDKDGFPKESPREIRLIFPLTKAHLSDGIDTVLEWTEYADLPYEVITDKEKNRAVDKIVRDAEDTQFVANVTAKTVEILQRAEGDKYLILLWGADGSEEAELLLDAAEQAGITAKDLTAGLDDLAFGEDEQQEEPEPEPEPEPEEPKRGRGRRGRKPEPEPLEESEEELTEEDTAKPEPEPEQPKRGRGRKAAEPEPEAEEKPEEEEEEKPTRGRRGRKAAEPEPEAETLEQEVSRAAHQAQQQAAPVPEADVDLLLVRAALEGAFNAFRLEDERNAVINQADVRYRPLTELLQKALHTLGEDPKQEAGYEALAAQQEDEEPEEAPEEQEAPRRRRGRPRDESKTYAYLEDEDGNLTRRGRGRIPAGQKVVHLTRQEIEARGLDVDED